jgi:two-component system cell cycle response regulator DivK
VEPYILVVDDHADGREMLSEYLAFSGFAVATAADGAEALEFAFKRPPAIILMDLTMPVMDGWEATRRLKADTRTKHVPVIAVTANAMGVDEVKARAAGCDGFVAKPYDLTVLGETVERFMKKTAAGRNSSPVSKRA